MVAKAKIIQLVFEYTGKFISEKEANQLAEISFKEGDKAGYDRAIKWSLKVDEKTLNKIYAEHEKKLTEARQAGKQEVLDEIKRASRPTNTNMYGISLSKSQWEDITQRKEGK